MVRRSRSAFCNDSRHRISNAEKRKIVCPKGKSQVHAVKTLYPKRGVDIVASTLSHACPTRTPGDQSRMYSVLGSFFQRPGDGEEKKRRIEARIPCMRFYSSLTAHPLQQNAPLTRIRHYIRNQTAGQRLPSPSPIPPWSSQTTSNAHAYTRSIVKRYVLILPLSSHI